MDLNQVFLFGRVGRDPEINFLTSGRGVCKFSIATSKRFKKNGEDQETTHWHNVVVWGKMGEACAEHLKKGSMVFVTGSVETRSWEDKTTHKKVYTTEINASGVIFGAESHDARDDHADEDRGERRKGNSRRRREEPQDQTPDDDDIPF